MSTIDLRQVREEVQESLPSPVANVERSAVVPRRVSFSITYDAPDGNTFEEDLVSEVLDSDGRMAKARVLSALTRGVIAANLPEQEQLRLEALARVTVQLPDPPEWVLEWCGADIELLSEINNILVEHETRYFRGNNRQSGENTFEQRISISCSAFEVGEST